MTYEYSILLQSTIIFIIRMIARCYYSAIVFCFNNKDICYDFRLLPKNNCFNLVTIKFVLTGCFTKNTKKHDGQRVKEIITRSLKQ